MFIQTLIKKNTRYNYTGKHETMWKVPAPELFPQIPVDPCVVNSVLTTHVFTMKFKSNSSLPVVNVFHEDG